MPSKEVITWCKDAPEESSHFLTSSIEYYNSAQMESLEGILEIRVKFAVEMGETPHKDTGFML